jgi:hypothetical protein
VCIRKKTNTPHGNTKKRLLNFHFAFLAAMHPLKECFPAQIMSSDNKVRELATVCMPWQQWTETSVWFDDVGISAFHSCVVVDLWRSFSEWRLLMSECVFEQRMNIWSEQKSPFQVDAMQAILPV